MKKNCNTCGRQDASVGKCLLTGADTDCDGTENFTKDDCPEYVPNNKIKIEECKNCKEVKSEVEELRVELTELSGAYSAIAEKLWNIINKKR